ncbi:hypothetical protein SESBI_06917 [Sesbania bispinosa]|nr:hypothetical protein SESBI_06917 [Sesbania bispinosa]
MTPPSSSPSLHHSNIGHLLIPGPHTLLDHAPITAPLPLSSYAPSSFSSPSKNLHHELAAERRYHLRKTEAIGDRDMEGVRDSSSVASSTRQGGNEVSGEERCYENNGWIEDVSKLMVKGKRTLKNNAYLKDLIAILKII